MRIPKIAVQTEMINPYKRGKREDKLRNLQLSFYILIIRSTVSQKVREKTTSVNHGFNTKRVQLSSLPLVHDKTYLNSQKNPEKVERQLRPKEEKSFMDMFGIPMMKVRMIRVYVVVSQNIDIMKSICTSLSLSLSRYGIISEITVLCKEDYKFFLDNNHCDLCIVDNKLFNEVTNAYPFLYCSPITFKDKIVFLFLLVLFVG